MSPVAANSSWSSEEKRGWAFAGAEGLEKRIAACEELAETDAQREELASMRRRLADMRGK